MSPPIFKTYAKRILQLSVETWLLSLAVAELTFHPRVWFVLTLSTHSFRCGNAIVPARAARDNRCKLVRRRQR